MKIVLCQINPCSFKLLLIVTISGVAYQLFAQLPWFVIQSGITKEQPIFTAVSWCWCEVSIGKLVKLCLLSSGWWVYRYPRYPFTSQHTSSPPWVHFRQLSPSPIWFAWKPPQQSVLQRCCQCVPENNNVEHNRAGEQRDIYHYLILLGWGLHESSTPGISKFLPLFWLNNPEKNLKETSLY